MTRSAAARQGRGVETGQGKTSGLFGTEGNVAIDAAMRRYGMSK